MTSNVAVWYNYSRGDIMKHSTKTEIGKTNTQTRYNTVVKSNELIQKSRFSLSTLQQKILLYIISQISPYDNEFGMYEFSVVDFCKVCGIDPQGDMYRLIKDQIKNIADKSLWIELEDGNETLVRWIERPYIDKKSGIIRIKLDDEMKPYLLQLKQQFTKYDLIYTLNFKSKYSIRLYEYLKSIHFQKFQEYQQIIPIDKFQLIMDSNYNEFKDFHTRALKPAYQEINEYTDISFEYQPIKDGKRVTAIKVIVNTKSVEDRMNVVRDNERLLDERCGKVK